MSGIFGVVSKADCYETLIYGTDYHSHLGTEFGGVAVLGEGFHREIRSISQSQFKAKFFENGHPHGNSGIGAISSLDEQPVYLHSKFGKFCLVTTGFIENAAELAERLMASGISFAEVSKCGVNMTELIGKLIVRGESIVAGIEEMFDVIKGSCSLLLLHEDGLYAARDRHGYNSLTIGQKLDTLAVTSESCAFPNLGFQTVKDLTPGEISLLTRDGLQERVPASIPRPRVKIAGGRWRNGTMIFKRTWFQACPTPA